MELDIDPEYIKATTMLKSVDGINVVDVDIEVIKEHSEVGFQAVLYRHNVDHYEHFYKSEMEFGCTHDALKDPILNFIFKELLKYGNLTEACPLKLGHYQMKGFKIDTADMPHQLQAGSYRFDLSACVKKSGVSHDIYTDKYYVTI